MAPKAPIKYSAIKNVDNEDRNNEVQNLRPRQSLRDVLIPRFSGNTAGMIALPILWVFSIWLYDAFTTNFHKAPSGTYTQTSPYSPFYDRVSIPTLNIQRDDDFVPDASDPEHVYYMEPSPEVDTAWERLTQIPYFPASLDVLTKLGKDTTRAPLPPDSWDLGLDKNGKRQTIISIEVFHQLHCLNRLRRAQVHLYDHYWGKEYGSELPPGFEEHQMHCINMLRQTLSCHADMEPVVLNWVETQPLPVPDFNLKRTCKDFNALLEWQEGARIFSTRERWEALKDFKPQNMA